MNEEGIQSNLYSLFNPSISPDVKSATKAMVIAECAKEMNAELVVPMTKTSNNYIWLYLGLTVLMIALNYIGNVAFASFTLSVAKRLHNKMVTSLLHA